jgi:hypothetical protein
MLEEARARMVDVETGVEPRPMRPLYEEPPATPPEPPASRVSNGRAVKRPSFMPAPVAASRAQPQPEGPTQEVPLHVPEPEPVRIAVPEPSAAMLGDDEVLWLEDRPGHMVTQPGDSSTRIAPWRRGLRG